MNKLKITNTKISTVIMTPKTCGKCNLDLKKVTIGSNKMANKNDITTGTIIF